MAAKGKERNKETCQNLEEGETVSKVTPGTIEVSARIMGEDGKWMERTIQVNSGVTVGTFDTSSRNGYLTSFDSLEQVMIEARNEASRKATELFLREVGKKRKQ